MSDSRHKKMDAFYALAHSGQTVLDVGVSAESPSGGLARNIFLKSYRFPPETYTGLGVQNMDGMSERFPGMHFVQYPGGKFPFEDNSFDWAFSNAVIEHVGNETAQAQFISEMLRVARVGVFVTTPAQEFPIETHTLVPFLHWWPKLFFAWCKLFRPHWKPTNLNLFTRKRLESMLNANGIKEREIYCTRFMGFPMTWYIVVKL